MMKIELELALNPGQIATLDECWEFGLTTEEAAALALVEEEVARFWYTYQDAVFRQKTGLFPSEYWAKTRVA